MKTTFHNCPPEARTALRIQARKAMLRVKDLFIERHLTPFAYNVSFVHPKDTPKQEEGFFALSISPASGIKFWHSPGAQCAYRITYFFIDNTGDCPSLEFTITSEPWAQTIFKNLLDSGEIDRVRDAVLQKQSKLNMDKYYEMEKKWGG